MVIFTQAVFCVIAAETVRTRMELLLRNETHPVDVSDEPILNTVYND